MSDTKPERWEWVDYRGADSFDSRADADELRPVGYEEDGDEMPILWAEDDRVGIEDDRTARLIAKAPEMYELLRVVGRSVTSEEWHAARAIMRYVEGEDDGEEQ